MPTSRSTPAATPTDPDHRPNESRPEPTMTDTIPPPPLARTDDADVGRSIRPRRGLPGGRAVVGAFLVVVAAVGTFGAYLSATAAPDTSFMVATRGFEIGHVIEESDLVGPTAGVRAVPVELPEEQVARAVGSAPADAERLLGRVVVAPVAPGDLLQHSSFAEVRGAEGVVLSLSLPLDRALAGQVGAGERIDVIATTSVAGGGSETRVVARGVTVVAVGNGENSLAGGRVTLTVEVPDLATAQRLQHAVDTAQVALLRGGDPAATTPSPTRGDGAPPTEAQAGDAQSDAQEQG